MAKSKAETVDEYLAELPEERRAAISAVRQVVLDSLPEGYEEMMQFGMIGYVIPLVRYPVTYNGQALQYAKERLRFLHRRNELGNGNAVFSDDYRLSGGSYFVHNLEAFSFELRCDDGLHDILKYMTIIITKVTQCQL